MLPLIVRKRSVRLAAAVGLGLLFQSFVAGAHELHHAGESDADCVVCLQLDRTDPGIADMATTTPAIFAVTAPDAPPPQAPCGRSPIAPSSRGPPAFS